MHHVSQRAEEENAKNVNNLYIFSFISVMLENLIKLMINIPVPRKILLNKESPRHEATSSSTGEEENKRATNEKLF